MEWLRARTIGTSCFPPLNRLHVWWVSLPSTINRTLAAAALLHAHLREQHENEEHTYV
jgi:hypothetical protein